MAGSPILPARLFRGNRHCYRPRGKSVSAVTNHQGIYELKGLAPGSYNVTVTAKGFAVDQEADVNVVAGQSQELDVGCKLKSRNNMSRCRKNRRP